MLTDRPNHVNRNDILKQSVAFEMLRGCFFHI